MSKNRKTPKIPLPRGCARPATFALNKNTSDLPFFGPIERVPDRVTNL